MSQPAVNQTEGDGSIGVLPATAGRLLAVVGVCTGGPTDTPATWGRAEPMIAAHGGGPAVQMAARMINVYGRPVVLVRTGQTTAGAMGTIDDDGVTGTANGEITQTGSTEPLDDYEVRVVITLGGTLGTGPIRYVYSLDGGRTFSPEQSLGTGLVILIPGTGVSFSITTATTLVTGDYWTARTTAPAPDATELAAALTALKNAGAAWEIAAIATPLSATLFDTVETAFAAITAAKKFRSWVGSVRTPNEGESDATYQSAMNTAFSGKSTKVGELCAGAALVTSSVDGRKYRRSIDFVVAPFEQSVQEHVNIADIDLGAIVGCSLTDDNGNLLEHDESVNPGLDDLRFTVLRSHEGYPGVYVNRPRIFSTPGSDYYLHPHRRVMNLARGATYAYLLRRLNKPIRVDRNTGFILEADALAIEAGGRAALAAVLGPAPKASGWSMVVARNDNLLSTFTLNVTTRVISNAYIETIEESIAFTNPAQAV